MESKFSRVLCCSKAWVADHKWYQTVCSCHSQDHTVGFRIGDWERDDDISLTFDLNISTGLYDDVTAEGWKRVRNLAGVTWRRLVAAAKLVFRGEIKMSGEFIFFDLKHVEEVISALQEGVDAYKEKKSEERMLRGQDEGD